MREGGLLSGTLQPSSVTADQMTLRNILLATDFSECSERALSYALGIASRYESRLHLFHCIDPTPYNLVEPDAVQTARDDARRELERLASDLRRGRAKNVEVKVVAEAGDLAVILPRVVKDLDLGLIVVGTHDELAGGSWSWDRLPRSLWTKFLVRFSAWGLLLIGHGYKNSGPKTFCWPVRPPPVPNLRNRMPLRSPANMALGSP